MRSVGPNKFSSHRYETGWEPNDYMNYPSVQHASHCRTDALREVPQGKANNLLFLPLTYVESTFQLLPRVHKCSLVTQIL